MSILLKDVPMPRTCAECPCCSLPDEVSGEMSCMVTLEALDKPQTRPDWCPMVEVEDAWYSHHPHRNIYAMLP